MALIRCMRFEVKKMKQRLIDANALRNRILWYDHHECVEISVGRVCRDIDAQPTVEAVPTVHSEWFFNGDGSGSCMNCGKRMKIFYDEEGCMKFCPNCGAKMKIDE